MRAVTLGTAVLALCLAGSLGAIDAADEAPVTIAVLRGDGILIPIITRRGTTWIQTWPPPMKAVDVPLGMDGIPKRWWGKPGAPATWHAWQIDGTTSDLAAERPTWYLAHCQQAVGLKTALTARPPVPPPTMQPYPKLGLASSRALAFRRIEPVDQNDAMWMTVVDAVGAAVVKAENDMGRPTVEGFGRPLHPTPAAERAKVATRVEALYRVPIDGGRVLYYVEATKRYGMPPLQADQAARTRTPQRGCSVMTFANGFFVAASDRSIPPPSLNARVSSCDYDQVSLMLPLAAVGEGSSLVWIGQITSWQHEAFAGFRWDERGKIADVFLTPGGACVDD